MTRRRVHVHVSGKVQGVWYRESTREEAERLGVDGWVRNLADGRVEAVFCGAADAVEAILEWCQDGPPDAQVDAVDVRDEATGEDMTGFAVLR